MTGLTAKQFTVWGDDVTELTNGKLYTATVPSNVSDNSSPTYTEVSTAADQILSIPLKAWIQDTTPSPAKDQVGHTAAWQAAIAGMTENKTVTVTYAYQTETAASEGHTALETEEVFYYVETLAKANYAAAAASSNGLTHSNEAVSASTEPAGHKLTVDATGLSTANSSSDALIVGYLHVRFDGRHKQQNNSVTYSCSIAATGAIS